MTVDAAARVAITARLDSADAPAAAQTLLIDRTTFDGSPLQRAT